MSRITLGIVIGSAILAALISCNNESDTVELVSAPMPANTVHEGPPPRQYRHGGEAKVVFSDNVGRDCVAAGHKIGFRARTDLTNACAVLGGAETVLIVKNPCRESGAYAAVLCHELGHVNGWPVNHPR